MKVAGKLVFVILVGISALLCVDGYLLIQREITRFESQLTLHARELGQVFRELVADVWALHGQERALQRIEDASHEDHQARIRWVWIDAAPTEPYGPSLDDLRVRSLEPDEIVSLKSTDSTGVQILYTYVRVPVEGQPPGALEVSQSLSPLDAQTRDTIRRVLLLTSSVVLITAFLAAISGVTLIGRPLNQLAEKARRVGRGDRSRPLRLRGRDELSQLANAFNSMCADLEEAEERARTETRARIAALEQLRHEDRLRTVGRLASGLAHELGTPLNVISGRAELISQRQLTPDQDVESARIIKAQADRMTRIIEQLLDFARLRSPQKQRVDLLHLARQTIEVLSPLGQKRGVSIGVERASERKTVQADPAQLQQVLMNLLMNAIDASADGGSVSVGVVSESSEPPEGQRGSVAVYACLRVRDSGHGIDEGDLSQIFEPFFTTKDVGEGTGLGLSIADGIVREHGGWISVESDVGEGTCFSVYLPQEAEECTAES